MQQVLFLCSGNYYRSRFAEHVFNRLAEGNGMPWRADSRGLTVGGWAETSGQSPRTPSGANARGILNGRYRCPQQATEDDFGEAEVIVAVKESEHRPVMADLFPAGSITSNIGILTIWTVPNRKTHCCSGGAVCGRW